MSSLAKCFKANRLIGFRRHDNIFDRAKSMVGSSLGQLAYNKIDKAIPRDLIGANVNSNVRALVDSVRSGVVQVGRGASGNILDQVFGAAGVDPNMKPRSTTEGTIFENGKAAGSFIADRLVAGVLEEVDLPGPIGSLVSMAFVQQNYGEGPRLSDLKTPDCTATPYAMDLLEYAPKHNFMFMVEFIFVPDYRELGMENSEKETTIKFHYLCRMFQRPEINFEYEDINIYNFKTKVAKRTTYSPVTMRLYDDIKNSSMEFLEKYLKAMSPVANIAPESSGLMEYQGMAYEPGHKPSKGPTLPGGSGSLGGFINNNVSILRMINVYHVFDFGRRVNMYSLINPKLQKMSTNEFSMEEQEPATVDLEFVYDSYYIRTNLSDQEIGLEQLQDRSRLGTRYIKKFGD